MSKLLDTLSRIFIRSSDGELKNITGSIDNSLSLASGDLEKLALQYIIPTASGEWLNEWGSWFGVPRRSGETDPDYRNRILVSATKPKNTIPAIIDAVNTLNNITGGTVIYEPYSNVAKFNVSAFSGKDHLQNGGYWRHNTIDILMPGGTNVDVYSEVQKIKAAGIKVYFTSQLPMELDKSFYDAVKIHDSSMLSLDLTMARMITGSLLSDGNTIARGRSGTVRTWGTSIGFIFDIEKQSFLRGYDGVPFSEQHTIDKLYESKLVEKQPPSTFSSQYGVLSSDIVRKSELVEIEITPWIRGNYQPDFVATVLNLRPGDRSSLGMRSGRYAMSGIHEGGWTPKPFYLFQNAGYVVFDILNSASDTSLVEVQMYLDKNDWLGGSSKRTRSSRKTTWEHTFLAFDSGYPFMRRQAIGSPIYTAKDISDAKQTFETIYEPSKTSATTFTDQHHTRVYTRDVVELGDFTDFQAFLTDVSVQLQANIGSPTSQIGDYLITAQMNANAKGMDPTASSMYILQESDFPMMRRTVWGSPVYSVDNLNNHSQTYETIYHTDDAITTTFSEQDHTRIYKQEVTAESFTDYQSPENGQIFSLEAKIGSPTDQKNEDSEVTTQMTTTASGMKNIHTDNIVINESGFPIMRRYISASTLSLEEISGSTTFETTYEPSSSLTTTLSEEDHTREYKIPSDVTLDSEDHVERQGDTKMVTRYETLTTTMVEDVF